MMKLATIGVACDLKSHCFACVVKSAPRDSAGQNIGYHCKMCKIDILCPAGIARQYDKVRGELIDVCPKCGEKLEKGSYSLNTKMQKGYKSYPVDASAGSPLMMNATMEVPEWVFWAKPGDISEVNAKISPCISNTELYCLVVVLNSKSCFTEDSKLQKIYNFYPADAMLDSPLKMNATMEVPEWVLWAKSGDIAEVNAKVSPCIGNRELNCLVVVLNSKNCFSDESDKSMAINSFRSFLIKKKKL
ncbi:MAG: hypothetical protein ACFFCD_15075 [Promethearchaeota archaeon]